MPSPSVLLLDLDDTILQDGVWTEACWREVCIEFAPHLSVSVEELYTRITDYTRWYWSDADRHRRGRVAMEATRREIVRAVVTALPDGDRWAEPLAAAYSALRAARTAPFTGAIAALTTWRTQGLPLGLLTNGGATMQREKLTRFQLVPYFDLIWIEGERGIGKPDVRVFQEALVWFGVSASAAWMIGNDLAMDIAPAAALGLTTVWIDHGNGGSAAASPAQPSHAVHTLAEVVPLLRA